MIISAIKALPADIAYVLRRLTRRPLYVGTIVAVLALAMGASLAVFGLVDTLILRPLDVPHPEELVTFRRVVPAAGRSEQQTTMDWPQVSTALSLPELANAAISTTGADALSKHVVVTRPGQGLDDVPARFVTWNYLRVLGIRPALGRDLQASDDQLTAPPVTIVTHAYWREHLGGSRDAVGQVVRVNGVAATVIGVLGPSFAGTELGGPPPALLLPLYAAPAIGANSPSANGPAFRQSMPDGSMTISPVRPARTFQVIARVPGNRDALQAEAIARLWSDQWSIVPLTSTMLPFDSRTDLERFLRVLALAVGLTLFLGCVNVGILVYGDAEDRRRELMVRAVLGASVGRVVQLVALEMVILAMAAGVGAAAIFAGIQSAVGALALPGTVAIESLRSDALRTGLFAMTLAVAIAVFIGIMPVRWVRRRTLAAGDRTMTAGIRSRRVLRLLGAFQAAASVALVVSGVFFARAVSHSLRTDLGFDPAGLMHAVVGLPPNEWTRPPLTRARTLLTDIRALPGIRAATIGPVALVAGSDDTTSHLHIDGQPLVLPAPIDLVYASDDYFRTLGQTGLRGRDFGPQDTDKSGYVAIVNEAAARMLWPGTDPLTHHLMIDKLFQVTPSPGTKRVSCRFIGSSDTTPICNGTVTVSDFSVVGVVPTIVLRRLDEAPSPIVYLPLSQFGSRIDTAAYIHGTLSLIVRSAQGPAATSRLIAEAAQRQGLSIESVTGVEQARDVMIRPQRLARALLLFLAMTTLVITLAGTGAAAHTSVLREQRANAVRLALGASPGRLVSGSIGRTARTLAVGAAGGVLLLWWVRPLLERFGMGLPALDPISVGLACVGVITAGVMAAYLPNRRIHQLDPVDLLRE
jgi:predicted permease